MTYVIYDINTPAYQFKKVQTWSFLLAAISEQMTISRFGSAQGGKIGKPTPCKDSKTC